MMLPERDCTTMMKLYWSPRSRSFSALWLMEETGQPYERVLTDISKGAQKTPEYLAINPMGKVPALKDGDATLAEAAAICAYVAELHRTRDGAARDQDRDELGVRGLGRCAAGVRRARRRADERTLAARGNIFGRGHRNRLGAEFRGAAIQDGAVAPLFRALHRRLCRTAGVPTRQCPGSGIKHDPEKWEPVFHATNAKTRLRADHAQK